MKKIKFILKKKNYVSVLSSIQDVSKYIKNDKNLFFPLFAFSHINKPIKYGLGLKGFYAHSNVIVNFLHYKNINLLEINNKFIPKRKPFSKVYHFNCFFKNKKDYILFYNFVYKTIIGLFFGYSKTINLVNINFKIYINMYENILTLFIGKSHGNSFFYNRNIYIILKKKKKILTFISFNKMFITNLMSKIKKLRPISKYKNKGIKYSTDIIKFKEGKSKQR